MPLNNTQILNLKPKEKPWKVSDFDGLYVTATPSGSKLWHMKNRIDGREKRLSFGVYHSVPLAQARGFRDEARALLANGDDPGVIKKALKQTHRFASDQAFARLAAAFMAKSVKEGRAQTTKVKTAWLLGMANADFGSMPITETTSRMVLACLWKVEAKGNYETARRLRAKIGAVFRYAIATGASETDPNSKSLQISFRENSTFEHH